MLDTAVRLVTEALDDVADACQQDHACNGWELDLGLVDLHTVEAVADLFLRLG